MVENATKNCFNQYLFKYVKFLQSYPPITETFTLCLIVYLYNMFQPSTGSSSGTNELNYQNDFSQFQKLIKHLNNLKLIKSKSNIKNIIKNTKLKLEKDYYLN